MSKCILSRLDVKAGNFPAVCMRCGEASTTTIQKKFSWYPSWVLFLIFLGLLPFLIVGLLATQRMKMSVPFCERHQNHFSFRNRFAGFGILGLIGALILIVITLQEYDYFRNILLMALGILFLLWFIALVVLGQTAIRPTEINTQAITLVNVHSNFVEASRQSCEVHL